MARKEHNVSATFDFLWASRQGDVARMKRERANGADIDHFDGQPLRNAAHAGHRDAVAYLCSIGARYDVALGRAAGDGDLKAVITLLDFNGKSSETVATLRAAFAHIDLTEVLDANPRLGDMHKKSFGPKPG